MVAQDPVKMATTQVIAAVAKLKGGTPQKNSKLPRESIHGDLNDPEVK